MFLEFKYVKNRVIDLGNGESYDIPYRMESGEHSSYDTKIPVFNLDKVHKVKLLEEEPILPSAKDKKQMSERKYAEICDDAWTEAREARKSNRALLDRIYAYVQSGTIEVVNDPTSRGALLKSDESSEEDGGSEE